jgi:hypothetical protein
MTRLKAMAKLLVVSAIISTASPALATQVERHERPAACRHQASGSCVAAPNYASHRTEGNTTHNDWPANMILD